MLLSKALICMNFFLYKQKWLLYQEEGYLWLHCCTSHTDHITPQTYGFRTIGNILKHFFFSETTDPNELKLHMKTPYDTYSKRSTKYYGHMTKMTAMPVYGKSPLKIFFSRNRRPLTLGLDMYIRDVRPTKFVEMMILG